ncbi:nucleotidyl transferase AbiEii/AbiGii toxin family protein [Streptomyces sp. NPDC055722]
MTSPETGESCEVDVLKENFWASPAPTEHGPVLAIDDVIGTKVRALADRGAVRDLIDVHAATASHTIQDLERLGNRHGLGEFSLHDLRERLSGAECFDDDEFAAYSLAPGETSQLRMWAQRWA